MDMSSMTTANSSTTTASSSTTTSMTNMMTMTFHSNTIDSLWFSGWTPNSGVSYAFTLVALVVLGLLSRALHAYNAVLERRTRVRNLDLAHVVVQTLATHTPEKVRESQVDATDIVKAPLTVRTDTTTSSRSSITREENVRLVNPWRLSVDLRRGLLYVVSAGIGYLLMLAIMTANVGYFFAVLGGLFLGEVAFGRFAFAPVIAPGLVEHS